MNFTLPYRALGHLVLHFGLRVLLFHAGHACGHPLLLELFVETVWAYHRHRVTAAASRTSRHSAEGPMENGSPSCSITLRK